jgi:hypothetical protein
MVTTQSLALASFTTKVLLILAMVMTRSLLTEALMALVPDMVFITTAVQLLLVMVTTPLLLIKALSQPRTAVEPGF